MCPSTTTTPPPPHTHTPAPGMVDAGEKDDMMDPLDKRMRHLEITGGLRGVDAVGATRRCSAGGCWASASATWRSQVLRVPHTPHRSPPPPPRNPDPPPPPLLWQAPCGSRRAPAPCCAACPSCSPCPRSCSRASCARAASRVGGWAVWAGGWVVLRGGRVGSFEGMVPEGGRRASGWAGKRRLLHCPAMMLLRPPPRGFAAPHVDCCFHLLQFLPPFHLLPCLSSLPPRPEYKTGETFWAGTDVVARSGGESGPGAFVVLSGVIRRVHVGPDGTKRVRGEGGGGGGGGGLTQRGGRAGRRCGGAGSAHGAACVPALQPCHACTD